MVKYLRSKILLCITFCFLVAVSAGCSTSDSIPAEPPAITVKAGKITIDWIVGKNMWNGSTIEHIADFPYIMLHTTFDDLPYIKNDESIIIHFDNVIPDSIILTELILKEDGSRKYNISDKDYNINIGKNNIASFTIEANYATALSSYSGDYIEGNTIKGYRMVCTWGGNECEYVFIIRGDAAITMNRD